MQKTQFKKDLAAKTLQVIRSFNAPLEQVWRAFTEKEILDQWWGPQPWSAETKHMDFRAGGYWLYAMVGPDGSRHWSRANFIEIIPLQYYKGEDYFCDEAGNALPDLPHTQWENVFSETATGTTVTNTLHFAAEADLLKIVEMGFEQGYTIGLDQLEALLANS